MLSTAVFQSFLLLAAANIGLANPLALAPEHFEVLSMRASTTVDPAAVSNTKCLDASV